MNVFDTVASKYDSEQRVMNANIIATKLKEYLVGTKTKSALDLGCGTGLVGIQLLDYFESTLFVDTSSKMIEIVLEKIKDNNISNASAMCADVLSDFPTDIKVDYIYISQVLLHVVKTNDFLSKIYEILNPNGALLIVDYDKNDQVSSDLIHNGFDKDLLKDELLDIGYKDIFFEDFYQGEKMLMKKDATLFIMKAQK